MKLIWKHINNFIDIILYANLWEMRYLFMNVPKAKKIFLRISCTSEISSLRYSGEWLQCHIFCKGVIRRELM